MRQLNWLSRTALAIVCLLGAPAVAGSDEPASTSPAPAAKEDAATKFLRIRRDDQQQPVALETAVTRYVPKPSTDQ